MSTIQRFLSKHVGANEIAFFNGRASLVHSLLKIVFVVAFGGLSMPTFPRICKLRTPLWNKV